MDIHVLLDGVTGTGAGTPVKINEKRIISGPIPFQLSGITTATVVVEGTIATQAEVDAGTAVWEILVNGSFTSDTADGILTAFPYIRGNVTAYTAGTITAKIQL